MNKECAVISIFDINKTEALSVIHHDVAIDVTAGETM